MPANKDVLEAVARAVAPEGAFIEHLGTGGFASTFRVDDGAEVYALKVIDPAVAEPRRVERELEALRRVDHAGVVRIIDSGTHDDGAASYQWIKMGFVEGRSLRQAFAAGEVFDHAEAIDLLAKLVGAAAAIWAEGTAHRDLSPGNIMITPEGDPVIVDLGMARHVDDSTYTVLPTPGTPGWMSPEQVDSTPAHGDWRSDQFVLGSIGYRLVTNVQPFWAPTLMECWAAPATVTPQPMRSIDPAIPTVVADVIHRMMNKQPHRRYLRVPELLADLDTARRELAAGAGGPEVSRLGFFVNISHVKNFAENGFLSRLSSGGAVIDVQAGDRVAEFADAARAAQRMSVIDPVTSYARSPIDVRPIGYTKLDYGNDPVLTGFGDPDARDAWCRTVWNATIDFGADTLISPYFYAGEGELNWVRESLACADLFRGYAPEANTPPAIWSGVLVHAAWLANDNARDQMLTALTGQPIETLHILVHTTQPSFAPLADTAVLRGFRDLFTVMHDAESSVVVGRRASSGLLLLALGADGWTTGIQGGLMNGAPHPEEDTGGGAPLDRIYVPRLLNMVRLETYLLMRQTRPDLVELDTDEAEALFSSNSDLESLTKEERVLLRQHNLVAQDRQALELMNMPAGQRIAHARAWVAEAKSAFAVLPVAANDAGVSAFLPAWDDALA
jgi:serine/threonine-protein kinase